MSLSSSAALPDPVRRGGASSFGQEPKDPAADIERTQLTLILTATHHGSAVDVNGTLPPSRPLNIENSLHSMEHFEDPRDIIVPMMQSITLGASTSLAQDSVCSASYGSHLSLPCRIPWFQSWPSVRALMSATTRHHGKYALRFEAGEHSFTRASLSKLERPIQRCAPPGSPQPRRRQGDELNATHSHSPSTCHNSRRPRVTQNRRMTLAERTRRGLTRSGTFPPNSGITGSLNRRRIAADGHAHHDPRLRDVVA